MIEPVLISLNEKCLRNYHSPHRSSVEMFSSNDKFYSEHILIRIGTHSMGRFASAVKHLQASKCCMEWQDASCYVCQPRSWWAHRIPVNVHNTPTSTICFNNAHWSLSHWGQVKHTGVSMQGHLSFVMACRLFGAKPKSEATPFFFYKWSIGTVQSNLIYICIHTYIKIMIEEKALEYTVYKMAAVLGRSECRKLLLFV